MKRFGFPPSDDESQYSSLDEFKLIFGLPMITCSHCGHQNPAGSKFCNNCGQLLPVICSNCGRQNPPAANFCNHCSHRLSSEEGAPAGDPPDPPAALGRGNSFSPTTLASPQQLVEAFESARQGAGQNAERRIVTILFCDIVGSTAAAGRFDPEDWTEIINGAFEYMIRPVYHFEGTVARLMGDGLLAFFGAPLAHEDDPERAVLAGLKIIENMQAYREQVQQRWDIDLNLRIGINTGLVTVGEVGSGLRAEYSALGDAINMAARMEQTAAPGTVQIADPTYRLVVDRFEFEELGPIQVKGKAEPVPAYRVIKRRDRPERLGGPDRLKAMFIGREKEKALLNAAVADLQSGLGHVVCLIGEAGLGKSRLIEELYAHGRAAVPGGAPEHTLTHWLACYGISYEMNRPYGLVQQLVRRLLGITVDTTSTAAKGRIAGIAGGQLDHDGIRMAAALNILLGIETQEPEPPLEGEAFKEALFAAVERLVAAWQANQPAVLVLDDLHWADAASVELINHLMHLVTHTPLVFLCLFRPERQTPSWSIKTMAETNLAGYYDEIVLQPLAMSESSRLVAMVLDMPEVSPELRETVIAKSEGNPFYIQEVARTLLEMNSPDQLSRASHLPGTSAVGDELPIPDSVQALLTARIDRLDDESRHVLQLASVIGRRFIFSVLDRIYEGSRLLEDQIHKLQQADLIEAVGRFPEREYQFSHTLIQEATYRTILRRDRRTFHRLVAEIIEQQFPNRIEEFATQLAFHYGAAGDLRAVAYHGLAGDIASRLHANADATVHYQQAIDLLRTDPTAAGEQLWRLFIRRGRALELVDLYAEALANYEDMQRLAADREDRAMLLDALVRQGLIRATVNTQFDPQKALALADHALKLAQELGDREVEARIHWNLLNIGRFGGFGRDEGIKHGEQALAIARELGHQELLAYILNDLFDAVGSIGEGNRFKPMVEEAIGLWRDLDNRPMLADSLSNAGTWNSFVGDYDLALQHFEEAYAISEEVHNLWGLAYSRSFSGQVYHDLGRPGEALRIAGEGIRFSDQPGFLVGRVTSRGVRGAIYSDLGAVEPGLKLARESYSLTEALLPQFRPLYAGHLAKVYLQIGDIEAAAALVENVSKIERTIEVFIRSSLDLMAVKVKLAQQSLQQALILGDHGSAWLRSRGLRAFLPDFLIVQAEVLQALARDEEAISCLQEARDTAEEIGNLRSLWPALAMLAKYEKAGQWANDSESKTAVEQARQIILTIANETPEYDPDSGLNLRALFLSQPKVQEIVADPG